MKKNLLFGLKNAAKFQEYIYYNLLGIIINYIQIILILIKFSGWSGLF